MQGKMDAAKRKQREQQNIDTVQSKSVHDPRQDIIEQGSQGAGELAKEMVSRS
jgi:hypothetical protein